MMIMKNKYYIIQIYLEQCQEEKFNNQKIYQIYINIKIVKNKNINQNG